MKKYTELRGFKKFQPAPWSGGLGHELAQPELIRPTAETQVRIRSAPPSGENEVIPCSGYWEIKTSQNH